MTGIKKKKCRNCKKLFLPDPRNANRQKYCSKSECQKASKASSQQRWLRKPVNRDYFRGSENVQRVQLWRKANPGYWRRKPKNRPIALQDSLITQPAVLIGLISQLTGYALQDDIDMAVRRMQQLGIDILNPHRKGGSHDTKTSTMSRSHP